MTILLKLGDCRDYLNKIPENTIDCVFTDPPYLINKGKAVQWVHNE